MEIDFTSIDKMVELGFGLAAARQASDAISQMMTPPQSSSTGQKMSSPEKNIYFAVVNGKQAGPYNLHDIITLIQSNVIVKETYIWKPGMTNWDLAENINEIGPLLL